MIRPSFFCGKQLSVNVAALLARKERRYIHGRNEKEALFMALKKSGMYPKSLLFQKSYALLWRRSAITCGCSSAIKCPQPLTTCAITLRQPNFLVSSLAVCPDE